MKQTIIVKDQLYYNLITLLQEIKLTQGNLALNGTLAKHPIIKRYLLECQVEDLQNLELDIQSKLERKS